MATSPWMCLILPESYQSRFSKLVFFQKNSGWFHDVVKLPVGKSRLLSTQQKMDVMFPSSKDAALLYYSSGVRVSPQVGLCGEAHPSLKRCKTLKRRRVFLAHLCRNVRVFSFWCEFLVLANPVLMISFLECKQSGLYLITQAGLSKELLSPGLLHLNRSPRWQTLRFTYWYWMCLSSFAQGLC